MKLEFLNPVQQKGLNCTVRRGARYAPPGEPVELVKTGSMMEGMHGVITAVFIMTADQVTLSEIAHEHDPECRTLEGLWAAMKRAYYQDFGEGDIVTIIYYEVD